MKTAPHLRAVNDVVVRWRQSAEASATITHNRPDLVPGSETPGSLGEQNGGGSGSRDPATAHVADYSNALAALQSMLLARVDLPIVLQAVCVEVVKTVPGADMAGITVLDDDGLHPSTAASTDARVNDVDLDQYRADEGPCLDAARTRTMVRARTRDVARRWPEFADNVSGLGVESFLSAPLTLEDRHLGALNIYGYDPHGFTAVDEALVQLLVMAIETAVQVSRRAESAEHTVDGLRIAMQSRAGIEQAKGIIMAVRGVGADDAFAIIAKQSQERNVKVTEIAASLIASVLSSTAPER